MKYILGVWYITTEAIKWVRLAEWYYNTTLHTKIKMTNFEALYGIKPLQLALGPYQQTNIAALEELLQERHKMGHLLMRIWHKLEQK